MAETSTTLFVGDLPQDVHETDFVAAFKSFRGYTTARLRQDKNDRPVGFVEFEDHESAAHARDAMTDHRFARGDRGIIIQFSNPSRSSSSKRSRSDSDSYSSPHYSSSSSSSSSSSHGYSQPPPYGHYGGYGSYGGYGYGSTPPPPSYLYNSLPADASSTLFVEGLPADVTVREVSHIFRPFPGYQSLRIVPKESKADPAKVFTLCFVEYDSKVQSYAAMQSLQGYRMDDKDNQGLRISYARSNLARRGGGGSGGGGSAGERGEERDRRRDDRDKPMKMDTMPSQ